THVHTTLYSIRSSCTYILSRHCFLFHAVVFFFFFFNHPAPTEIYTLSLHDALPISSNRSNGWCAWTSPRSPPRRRARRIAMPYRSEEHTSELQSRGHLVCRLLLEKKKQTCQGVMPL